MRLSYRSARPDDFEQVYRNCQFGYEFGDHDTVAHVWSVLVRSDASIAMVVENEEGEPDERIVVYTHAVFVTNAFAERARAGMTPYVNLHITKPMPDGSSPLLNRRFIRATNAGDGLILLTTETRVGKPALSPRFNPERVVSPDVVASTLRAFESRLRGFKIVEVLHEAIGVLGRQYAEHCGLKLRHDHAEYYRDHPPTPDPSVYPYLMGLTRTEALASREISLAHLAFVYTPPLLSFTPSEQDLLRLALEGLTDEQIATELVLTREAIRMRWRSIYRRVSIVFPDMLPEASNGRRRGEKRRIVLAYLRDHLEELH